MSGICGILRTDDQSVDYSQLSKILDNMKNRGNDKKEIKIKNNIGFAHAMLWTTTESLTEKQPLVSSDGLYLLTADARVDNRKELIEKLQHRIGYDTPSDSQLILMAYQEWAEKCPLYIVGDFAFAIKDNRKQQLFCARDRIGIKPFYYFFNHQSFVFSSEISALFAHDDIIKKPNIQAIQDFLCTLSIEYEQTLFQKIMRLPASHYIIIKDSELSINRYWFPEKIQINNQISYEDATIKIHQLLTNAIESCTRSAYPIACELSGGIDSSSILCIAKELKGIQPILPMTLRYKNMKCDEGEYSNAVLSHLGIKGKKLWINSSEDTSSLEKYYKLFPDWSANGEFLGIFLESEAAKKNNIRVLLTGQGGDHLFDGSRYAITDFLTTFQWKKLYDELKYYKFSKSIIFTYLISPFIPTEFDKLIRNIFGKNYINTLPSMSEPLVSFLDKEKIKMISQDRDLEVLLGSYNARWVDSNPYQNLGYYNIEVRHPFFDSRLIEFILSLPPDFKYKNGIKKRILRAVIQDTVPDYVLNRMDKAEFSEPIDMRINNMDTEVLKKESFLVKYKFVQQDALDEEIKKFHNKSLKNLTPLWTKILVNKWLKENF